MLSEILIDLEQRKLQLKEGDKIVGVYPVAVGAKQTPSPVGVYTITNKAHWGGGFGSRWMQLSVPWGTYGIHGTNRPGLIGQAVSHGCFRMHNGDVEEIYERVEVGTQVRVEGPLNYQLSVCGSRGNLVQLIQQRLREEGHYSGECDGVFGGLTEVAVSRWQKAKGLPVTGQVNKSDLLTLGIIP